MPLPPFDDFGNLPPGVHEANWIELTLRFGGNAYRLRLLAGLLDALRSLKQAGAKTAWIDGSFVTVKTAPGDFDVCYEVDSAMDPALLAPELTDFRPGRPSQIARFHGELFPADAIAGIGPNGLPATFLTFFQYDRRQKRAKGIVQISLEEL